MPAMKFGRIKRQHGRVEGLDELLDRIIKQCPHVTRIVPGRIKVRRGKTPPGFKVQYPTESGLKCQYNGTGTVQEVFLICSDTEAAAAWVKENVATDCKGRGGAAARRPRRVPDGDGLWARRRRDEP